jgi:hypothetical protein
MRVGWISRHRNPIRLFAVVAAAALALCSAGSVPAKADPDPDHVLQNVSVTMRNDGAITSIGSTVVSSDSGRPGSATTSTASFDPTRTASDLPVRVLTSYRAGGRTGTDLSDLRGASGRIEIDLTVQNLTVRPKDLDYDVAGSSVVRPALVGSPLTVVASTSLGGVSPATLVAPRADGRVSGPSTNGVISQNEKGSAQVQWAALLAPPQLPANATLRLVLDAKNFTVPTFNLSVQPGMVTDPSIAGLLDTSLQTGSTSELALQARTIQVVSQVNTVLVKASGTVGKVRTSLDTSARTVGTKTVSDLSAGSTSIASSMKGLSSQLDGLRQSVSAQMTTSRSTMLTQLAQTIATSRQLLGDTSAAPVVPQTSGTGCATNVAAPAKDPSVYGTLLQMAGQLDGYAKTTGACRTSLQKAILASAGPAAPTAEQCRPKEPASDSASCALLATQQNLDKVIDTLQKNGEKTAEDLGVNLSDNAVTKAQGIVAQTTVISALLRTAADGTGSDVKILPTVSKDLDTMATGLASLSAATTRIHTEAVAAARNEDAVAGADQKLADELCTLAAPTGSSTPSPSGPSTPSPGEASPSSVTPASSAGQADPAGTSSTGSPAPGAPSVPASPGGLSAQQADHLRSYLTRTSCPDSHGATRTLDPPAGVTPALDGHQQQIKAWQSVIKATTATDGQPQGDGDVSLPDALAALTAQRTRIAGSVTVLITGDGQQDAALTDLSAKADALAADAGTLTTSLTALQATLPQDVRNSYKKSADDARRQIASTISDQQVRIVTRSAANAAELGRMFDRSVQGMAASSQTVRRNGAAVVNSQETAGAKAGAQAAATVSQQVTSGLSSINATVGASVKDLDGASALLTGDLNKVLLDLGTRKVSGSGLLGAMSTNAALAGTADYQVALASETATSYANVRAEDLNGTMLRQAQIKAAVEAQDELPAFQIYVPQGVAHRSVYTFTIGGDR